MIFEAEAIGIARTAHLSRRSSDDIVVEDGPAPRDAEPDDDWQARRAIRDWDT